MSRRDARDAAERDTALIRVSEEVLDEMVRIIVAEVDPEQVILFGSRARGDQREDSDVDFVVVETEPFGKSRSRRMEAVRLWKALSAFLAPKDFLVYSSEEVEIWRDSPTHVLGRALREGRMLYERP